VKVSDTKEKKMPRVLLNSTQVAVKAGLSAKAFNELLYKKEILNKRGRQSKKNPKVFKPYWDLLDLKYGQNNRTPHGGNNVKFYENMIPTLFSAVGVGSLV
jgi:hypothetical protein